jgi:hypothetical protein
VGLACPLLIPIVVASDLSSGWKTVLSGLLGIGIPDVFTIAAVGVMGKQGFDALKQRAFALLRSAAPPDRVGPIRHRIGLAMFVIPLVFGWAGPYLPVSRSQGTLAIAGDISFLASFFVLGGDFWDKIRALFVRDMRVTARGGTGPAKEKIS